MPLSTRNLVGLIVVGVAIVLGIATLITVLEVKHHRHHLAVTVNLSDAKLIPATLFGINIEEGNHAISGGLWAEMVSNRGFEAGGAYDYSPWSVMGGESFILVSIDYSSCFNRNKAALKMVVLKNSTKGVGVYNPGFWGMSVSLMQDYKLIFYVRSEKPMNVTFRITPSNSLDYLARTIVQSSTNWTRHEYLFTAEGSESNARLLLTVTEPGTIWFDQVSLMPKDDIGKRTGFRSDILSKLRDLQPGFLRFPGGRYVEGRSLRNSFRWKTTVGPWEERPGHYNDAWGYWSDDGMGFYEYLLLAEDLGAAPVWVVNCGISIDEHLNSSDAGLRPYVKDMLDGIEFANGYVSTTWGGLRAEMGHESSFNLKYIAIGSRDCQDQSYKGNYMEFYNALKQAYPDILAISNCDGSSLPIEQPADLFESQVYFGSSKLYESTHRFDETSRIGPKAFVSRYSYREDGGTGKDLEAALSEAAVLLGIEKNSDVVAMASYATLLGNSNDERLRPEILTVDSSRVYVTPSYWVQRCFVQSNQGASLVNVAMEHNRFGVSATAIIRGKENDNSDITLKFLNMEKRPIQLDLSFSYNQDFKIALALRTSLNSSNLQDENSFDDPYKVGLSSTSEPEPLSELSRNRTKLELAPLSFTSFHFLRSWGDST